MTLGNKPSLSVPYICELQKGYNAITEGCSHKLWLLEGYIYRGEAVEGELDRWGGGPPRRKKEVMVLAAVRVNHHLMLWGSTHSSGNFSCVHLHIGSAK